MFRETDFNKSKLVINVNDAMPDAYETLLLYIYTYEIYNDIKIEMFPDLVYLATKYKMPDFVDGYIGKFVDKDWPMSTVLKMFQLANEHNRPAMMKLVGKVTAISYQLFYNTNNDRPRLYCRKLCQWLRG